MTGESVSEFSKNFSTLRVVSEAKEDATMIQTENDFDQNLNMVSQLTEFLIAFPDLFELN